MNSLLLSAVVFGCLLEPVMAWNETQQLALALAPKFSGTLSIMGSVFIITDIVKSREKLGRTYSRILLVMSLYDFFTSIAQGLSTWPIPAETQGVKFASGTTFTCNFQGFFTQLGVGAPMYNCSLSFYYLIVIAFAFSEDRVRQIEGFMHFIPLSFSIGSAIAGLPLTLYNSAGLWCWIAALPGTCVNGNKPEGEGECRRGEMAWVYRWAIYYGPVWLSVVTITLNMGAVSYLVWAKERASNRFRFGHPSNLTSSSAASDAGSNDGELMDKNARAKAQAGSVTRYFASKRQKVKQKKRAGLSSQVFWQAFYYVVGFYITWITPTVLRMLQTIDKPVPFWVVMCMSILLPLQGFFNFLVYVRPRVVQYRNRHPENGLFNAIARAVRRTITVMYVSDSRAFTETEAQDIEVLDPCYALQVEKEEEHRRLSQEKLKIAEKDKLEYKENDEPHDNHVEKAPSAPRTTMEQRRLDEMRLLEEEDPSFHEGESIHMDVGCNSGDLGKNASIRSNGDCAPTDDNPSSLSSSGRQIVSGSGHGTIHDSAHQLSDIAHSNPGEESDERNQPTTTTQIAPMDGEDETTGPPTQRPYFYPEFLGDPDFFFT
ncbi:expressed unknown protein [Seminavis robusta]|uniref:Uncharacterized protein n=1 Tax=Seminavis robusta TaxID=568900 RepID=A0A9N8DJP2_9STRA|nr:expressed unknown protein [Seminavis robusta]|eukprot:Sro120_g058650.1 n/a (600) ;mRNA; f:93644-95794